MHRYKYRAINAKGRPIRGAIAAANEVDLYKQLQTAGLELVDCSVVGEGGKFSSFSGKFAPKIGLRDVIQFFVQMEQMQGAGVPLLDALADVRDATENQRFMDIMTDINRDVSDGAALSEAMNRHPKVFPPLYISLIEAGEETGDLTSSYRQLIKYLKWVEVIQTKVKKAIVSASFTLLIFSKFFKRRAPPIKVPIIPIFHAELPITFMQRATERASWIETRLALPKV